MTKDWKSRPILRLSLMLAVGLLTAGPMLASTPAQADTIVYNLTSDHCTGGCGPANTVFGTVELENVDIADLLLDADSSVDDVKLTVHLNSPYAFAKTGSADFQAFKFNATDVNVATEVFVDPHVPTLTASTGAYNGDGTGTFGFGIACASCGGGLSDFFTNDIVFYVANATIADLTAPNNLGNVFVADVGNLTTGLTGPVDATTPVPEPGTLLLVGTGLVSAGAWSRKRWFGQKSA
jgi:hypothetical protein